MKYKLLCVIIALLVVPIMGVSKNSRVTFFSPKSLYIYSTGSWMFSMRSDFHYQLEKRVEKANAITPCVGIGFTIFNQADKYKVNLECDYISTDFNFPSVSGRGIDFYTFIVNAEVKIPAGIPLYLYSGFGLALIDYRGGAVLSLDGTDYTLRDDAEPRVPLSFGLKALLTKHLLVRTEFREYSHNVGDQDFVFNAGDMPIHSSGSAGTLGAAIAFGLEYHFR